MIGKPGYDRNGSGHVTDSALENYAWLLRLGEDPERAAKRVGWSMTALDKADRERMKRSQRRDAMTNAKSPRA